MKSNNLISIVVPVYNEEDNILPLFREINLVIKEHSLNTEIIFVNDGSRDETQKMITGLFKKNKNILGVELRTKMGKAVALRVGFSLAKGNLIITLDGDLQDDPKDIPKFIKKINQGYDLVSGWKYVRMDPVEKKLPSKLYNIVTRFIAGIKLHDINSGYKAYNPKLAKELILHGQMHRYIPVIANSKGYKIGEVKVNHRPRIHGLSKYSFSRYLYGLFDLITVVYITKFQSRPLHVFGFMGFMLFGFGMTITSYLTFIRLVYNQKIGDRPLLLLGVLLIIIGVQVIIFGLLGEQITYLTSKNDYEANIKSINNSEKGV